MNRQLPPFLSASRVFRIVHYTIEKGEKGKLSIDEIGNKFSSGLTATTTSAAAIKNDSTLICSKMHTAVCSAYNLATRHQAAQLSAFAKTAALKVVPRCAPKS